MLMCRYQASSCYTVHAENSSFQSGISKPLIASVAYGGGLYTSSSSSTGPVWTLASRSCVALCRISSSVNSSHVGSFLSLPKFKDKTKHCLSDQKWINKGKCSNMFELFLLQHLHTKALALYICNKVGSVTVQSMSSQYSTAPLQCSSWGPQMPSHYRWDHVIQGQPIWDSKQSGWASPYYNPVQKF